MKIHTVFITYNRLELTKQAIESYLETVSVPFTLWVADNASEDGTQLWIYENICEVGMGFTIFPENRFPGTATNQGWSAVDFSGTAGSATHLHRADNDFAFLPGWCEEVERRFAEDPELGQLGLRTDDEELHNGHNVGGNCVIRRELWDAGLRYDERPWPDYPPGYTEDSFFSPAVEEMGWKWGRVERPCIRSLSREDPEDPYYAASWAARGIA